MYIWELISTSEISGPQNYVDSGALLPYAVENLSVTELGLADESQPMWPPKNVDIGFLGMKRDKNPNSRYLSFNKKIRMYLIIRFG